MPLRRSRLYAIRRRPWPRVQATRLPERGNARRPRSIAPALGPSATACALPSTVVCQPSSMGSVRQRTRPFCVGITGTSANDLEAGVAE